MDKDFTNIEKTLNSINRKLDRLRALDKIKVTYVITGILIMGLCGGSLMTIAVLYRQEPFSVIDLFLGSSLFVTILILGFIIAHKGFTGEWL